MEVWGYEKKRERETKESEELKTLSTKPRYDFSGTVWEITAKGNGERFSKIFVWIGENSPWASSHNMAVGRRT